VSKPLTAAALLAATLLAAGPVRAQAPAATDEPQVIPLRDALLLEPVGRRGRVAVAPDPVQALIASGRWTTPAAGDVVVAASGAERRWEAATADEAGRLQGSSALRGGYALFGHESPGERIMVLHAVGHSLAYVNGEPRGGDPYSTGFVRVPVRLQAGPNELLFSVSRGRLQARLEEPRAAALIDLGDRTLPDLVVGEPVDTYGGVVVINATIEPMRHLRLVAAVGDLGRVATDLPEIPPLSARKVPVRLSGAAPAATGPVPVSLELLQLLGPTEQIVRDTAEFQLAARDPADLRKRTFISSIDGSVQYYAVRPAAGEADGRPGLVLTLHGAGVEGRGQAACYAARDWAHVVAPTNRRPFGFDWEDWGRLDALEVLDLASTALGTDQRRTWLTGHSMGGHGTWNLGVHFPDRFAAIAPSAGWISFWSYTGAAAYEDADPIDAVLRRAASASDTLALSRNYLHQGVYVLHGDRDDNVPVDQARTMRRHLADYHADFAYYERPGAGHWWGNQCVDWPPLMEFLRGRTIPDARGVRNVEFVTASPGISATCHWVTIESSQRSMIPSRIEIVLDPAARAFRGTTDNVERVAIDLSALAAPETVVTGSGDERREETRYVIEPGADLVVELDGQSLQVPWPDGAARVDLARTGERWATAGPLDPARKGPHRAGPFKDAFRHRFMLVYGTRGSAAENAWACAKARYDAETFGYRGNGAVDVVADVDFDPGSAPDRGVILYGNADTNAAWPALLGASPVQVRDGAVTVGDRRIEGADLGVLLVRPRPDSDVACVAAVSGSGLHGMRLTDRLPYFVSGVGYPDVFVLGPEALERGIEGVRAAGFFGSDWSIETGEIAFRD
jgi:pimeloyl-ACP methyl ester carboxylesterase